MLVVSSTSWVAANDRGLPREPRGCVCVCGVVRHAMLHKHSRSTSPGDTARPPPPGIDRGPWPTAPRGPHGHPAEGRRAGPHGTRGETPATAVASLREDAAACHGAGAVSPPQGVRTTDCGMASGARGRVAATGMHSGRNQRSLPLPGKGWEDLRSPCHKPMRLQIAGG